MLGHFDLTTNVKRPKLINLVGKRGWLNGLVSASIGGSEEDILPFIEGNARSLLFGKDAMDGSVAPNLVALFILAVLSWAIGK